MKPKLVILMLFIFSSLLSNAQSKEILAKSSFLKAQEFFGNEDYENAIDRLLETKKLLGKTYSGIESLLARSYFQLNRLEESKASLKTYFEIADESDPDYNLMLLLIDDQKVQEQKLLEQKPERDYWEQVLSMRNVRSLETYLEKYPNGLFMKEAIAYLEKMPYPDILDSRDGQTYKTVRIGSQVWMAEDMRLDLKKTSNGGFGILYNRTTAETICPEGWRLPTVWDFVKLVEYLGGTFTYNETGALPHEPDANGWAQINPHGFAPKVAQALKSQTEWEFPGTNSSGFSAKPSGYWNAGLHHVGVITGYWTATESNRKNYHFRFTIWKPLEINFKESHNLARYSCRCIRE